MADHLDDHEITGVISTPRHRAARYRIGAKSGGMFEQDVDFDGFTLTIEVSGADDALAMLEAIKNG